MINTAIEEVIKRNEKDKKYNIRNTTIKQRNKLFLELLEKDNKLYMDIIYNRIKIPFYLMTKDEFKIVIKYLIMLKNFKYV